MPKQKNYANEYFKEDLESVNYSKKYNKYEARDNKRSKRRQHSLGYFDD